MLLGRDMPLPMVPPAEARPLHHLPGKFAIISTMPKLGSQESLTLPEPREGESAPNEAERPMPRERQPSPPLSIGHRVGPELIADPKGKGEGPNATAVV